MADLMIVTARYDDSAQLWLAASDDLGGQFLQATSWKTLVDQVPGAMAKLLPRGIFSPAIDIFIEVIAHSSTHLDQRSEDLGPGTIHNPARSCGQDRMSR